jgi:predicted phosphodiesterase
MEFSCVGPNQNRTPILGVRETLAPKEEASKVSLQGHAHALSASQKGWLVVAANAGSHDLVRVL